MRVLLANQNRGNIFNEYYQFFSPFFKPEPALGALSETPLKTALGAL